MHNHTTADAPETVYFVRSEFNRLEEQGIKCNIIYPTYKDKRVSMWSLIPQKLIPPTRVARYCCKVFKEGNGAGRFIVTGVRWAESRNRENNRGIYEAGRGFILNNDNDEKRRMFETCTVKSARVCNPIVDWTDRDVFDYIQYQKIPINPLYKEGFMRVGCVGCPMAGEKRKIEFARWPKYKTLYISAFDRMLSERKHRGLKTEWENAQEVYNWWMNNGVLPGQMKFEDLEDT